MDYDAQQILKTVDTFVIDRIVKDARKIGFLGIKEYMTTLVPEGEIIILVNPATEVSRKLI